jgi:hypothetical protein
MRLTLVCLIFGIGLLYFLYDAVMAANSAFLHY